MPKPRLNVAGDVKKKNALLLEKGAEQAVRDGDIPLSHYLKYKTNIEAFKAASDTCKDLPEPNAYWFWGAAGLGKSTAARAKCPNAFFKNCNKWWCGLQSDT
jgi:hypothetical protein